MDGLGDGSSGRAGFRPPRSSLRLRPEISHGDDGGRESLSRVGAQDVIAQTIDLLAFAAIGALIGALYFGRLWLTIRRLPRLNHPMLWLLAGTFARLALVLVAFLLLSQGHWARLVACLAGLGATWIYLRHKAPRSP